MWAKYARLVKTMVDSLQLIFSLTLFLTNRMSIACLFTVFFVITMRFRLAKIVVKVEDFGSL